MIKVERLNGEAVFINPELVRTVGERPDTILTFTDGTTLMIRGPANEFLEKWNEYRLRTAPILKDLKWK